VLDEFLEVWAIFVITAPSAFLGTGETE